MLTSAQRKALNQSSAFAQKAGLGDALFLASSGVAVKNSDDVLFVDDSDGSDANNGEDWAHALKTVQRACNLARYTKNTTTINSDKKRQKWIIVGPGQYNEQVLFSGYNIHVIGAVPIECNNGDYGAVMNYDGAVASTCVFGFTGAGIEIANLFINNAAAIPTLYVPSPGDGCHVHDCVINGDHSNATYGIQWLDCRNSVIERNVVQGHVTAEIAVGNGGATWFRNSSIRHNRIASAATKGITVVASTICGAADGSEILSNYIVGSATTGIHQDSAGAYVLVADNHVQAGTAVTDDGTGASDNHTAS